MKIEKVTNMAVSFSVQYLSKKKYVRNIIKGQNMFNVELLQMPISNGGLNGDETEKVNKVYEIQIMYKKIEKLYFKLNLKYSLYIKKKIEQNISGNINLN